MDTNTLNQEFSDEFDVLYNNISSNQAPGLDEYEKSLFLTRAQDDIVKSYFTPYLNKIQAGYDSNERRQIDFSMITKSKVYNGIVKVTITTESIQENDAIPWNKSPFRLTDEGEKTFGIKSIEDNILTVTTLRGGKLEQEDDLGELADEFTKYCEAKGLTVNSNNDTEFILVYTFAEPIFDLRENTKSVIIDEDVMMFINEYVEVTRDGKSGVRLTVNPITYDEYSRIMTKPYKRPIKNRAWRFIDNSNNQKRSEIVIGPGDELEKYVIRYVKRPRAIRLRDFGDEVTIAGGSTAQSCELDPILYPEIIQRAVEFAWATYKEPSLGNQITLGQSSGTNIGAVQSSNNRGGE